MKDSTKNFIKKAFKKTIIFALIMAITAALMWFMAFNPIVANRIAMGQMENSNEAYMFLSMYNSLKPTANTVYLLSSIWFVSSLAIDTYKYFYPKNINTEINKEI